MIKAKVFNGRFTEAAQKMISAMNKEYMIGLLCNVIIQYEKNMSKQFVHVTLF